jgi:hypothetical protein
MGFGEIMMIGNQTCPNCKGTNVTEILWGYPSRELLERSVDENDDPFVKISAMIGGDDYLKVARSLVRIQHSTEVEISKSTGLHINLVRRVLYDLFGKGIIEGVRVLDEKKDWFVYRWHSNKKKVRKFIEDNHLSSGSNSFDYPEFVCNDCNQHYGHQRFN